MTIFKSNDDGRLYTIGENRCHYYGLVTAEPYNHTHNYKESTNRRKVSLDNFTAVGHR